MNKNMKSYTIIWAILFVAFNVICFATPAEFAGMEKFGGAFWAGYIGITVAFIGQLVCAFIALKATDKETLFLNIPIIRISYTGLILTIVFGGACMAFPGLPNWVGIVVCLLITVFTAIAVVKAAWASDAVKAVDAKVKTQTFFVKSLRVDAESLLARATAPEAKEACKKVFEAIRYSDPMSSDALADVESQITLKFNELSTAVTAGADNIGTLADEVVVLIGDRNKRCKLVK